MNASVFSPRPALRTALLAAAVACTMGAAWAQPAWSNAGGRNDRPEWRDQRGPQHPGARGGERRDGWDNRPGDRRGDGRRHTRRPDVPTGGYFADRHRSAVRDYYAPRWRAGRCPPGLAKKNNGCMPPGQLRRWSIGQPLPRGVAVYTVPQPVVMQLGVPPPGYRYARVGSDILLLAVGTSLVVDAIQNIAGY